MEWPTDWADRRAGKNCGMCAEGRPERLHDGAMRIFEGSLSDAYLVHRDVGQRGYTLVIWRGRHISDPTQLTDDEAAHYFLEVLRVAKAIEEHYQPIKLNFDMLGNSLPHLHTHVVPRYADDGGARHPANFMRRTNPPRDPTLSEDAYQADVEALRVLLH